MLETHTNSPNVTNLSVEQLNAIDLLVQGLSDREVAEKVNVARETVTRWRNSAGVAVSNFPENAVFQMVICGERPACAELNKKRQFLWGAAQRR